MSGKEYFNRIASQWDQMRENFFSEAVRDRALSIAGVQKGRIAADIGAGTGFITESLILKGLQVIAIDQSEVMLAEMKKKFRSVNRINYITGEAENLPLRDEIVDYAFANMLLHHVENPKIAIKEMARILRSGGILVITDLDEHNFEFLKTEQKDRWLGFRRDNIKHWFTEAGLKDVKIECVGEKCCAQSRCSNEYASISIFAAAGVK